MKTKILADFQICISVHLIGYNLKTINLIKPKLGIIRHQSLLLKLQKNHLENPDCIHDNGTIPLCVAVPQYCRLSGQSETRKNREMITTIF